MFPIGDQNRQGHITPIVNYVLIAINVVVFLYQISLGSEEAIQSFINTYGVIPQEIVARQDLYTIFTSMFMHGGLVHLGGNMLYLWVFGDNLENIMGHKRYFIFYLLCGILSSLAHVFTTAFLGHNALIPALGASGAISAVLGGYMLLFPTRRVYIWVFLTTISVPAFLSVGIWFIFQVINGLGALGGEEAGGVAYAAHIGGFVVGLLLVKLFAREKPIPRKISSFR